MLENGDTDNSSPYVNYPLVLSMLSHEAVRTASLTHEGKDQITYPLSSDGWIRTIFIVRGRALDWMILPWTVVVVHATIYTVMQEIIVDLEQRNMETWEIFFRYGYQ